MDDPTTWHCGVRAFKTELIMDIVLFSCIAAFVAGIVVAAAHILT
jgi:hypothetical protein